MIETLTDWQKLLDCCCGMPECPLFIEECQSITGQLTSQGYIDPGETEWKRFLRYGVTSTLSASGSTTAAGPGDYGDYTATEYSADATYFNGLAYARLYYGGAGCEAWPVSGPEESCAASGSSTLTVYSVKVWGGPPANYEYAAESTTVLSISSAAGEETAEHIAWEVLFPTPEDYQAAVDAYEAYLEDYDAWAIAYTAWQDGGEIGDPPEEPAIVTEPPAEPAEFYPPCTFRLTSQITIYDHYFGINSDGSPAAPAVDQAALDTWWQGGGGGSGPPTPGTSTTSQIVPGNPLHNLFQDGIDTGDITESDPEYSEGKTLAEWLADAEELIDANLSFPSECTAEECEALRYYDGPPLTLSTNASVIRRATRITYRVPDTHGGTAYAIGVQILDEPDGWDDTIDDPEYVPPIPNDPPEPVPQIPKPGRPVRSFVGEPILLEWEGPGLGEQDNPSWTVGTVDIAPPSVKGTRRIVNRRFWCYPSSPYGYKPQISGEGVSLPDP